MYIFFFSNRKGGIFLYYHTFIVWVDKKVDKQTHTQKNHWISILSKPGLNKRKNESIIDSCFFFALEIYGNIKNDKIMGLMKWLVSRRIGSNSFTY